MNLFDVNLTNQNFVQKVCDSWNRSRLSYLFLRNSWRTRARVLAP